MWMSEEGWFKVLEVYVPSVPGEVCVKIYCIDGGGFIDVPLEENAKVYCNDCGKQCHIHVLSVYPLKLLRIKG